MKHYLLVLLAMLSINLSAQEIPYALAAPIGYATLGAGTTGGGNATPETVTTYSELNAALTSNDPKVILVAGKITFPENANPINIRSNKTLIGLPGAILEVYPVPQDKRKADGSGSGLLSIGGNRTNIIIRNIVFQGPGAWDTNNGSDLLSNQGKNIWVDHCEFYDGMDGNFDNNGGADNVSITWCKFGYSITPKPFVPPGGSSNDHRYSNLVGGGDSQAPDDMQYSITFAFCWWGNGVRQRMPRARNAQLHLLSCYYNAPGGTAIGLGAGNIGGTTCYVEHCNFKDVSRVADTSYPGSKTTVLSFVNCIGKQGANVGVAAKPTYAYDDIIIDANNVENTLTGTCGAGATLKVNADGTVSAGCDIPLLFITPPTSNATQKIDAGNYMTELAFFYRGSATGFEVVEKPDWITATPTGNTMRFTGATPSVTSTTDYYIVVKATDGTLSSSAITAKIQVIPPPAPPDPPKPGQKLIAFVSTPDDSRDELILAKLRANDNFHITIIDAAATGINYSGYDLIVMSAVPGSDSPGLATSQSILTVDKPKLMLKPFQLQNNRWNWSSAGAVNPNPGQTTMTVTNKEHEIFTGLAFSGENQDELQLFSAVITNAVTGIVQNTWRGTTELLATVKGATTQSIVEIPAGTTMPVGTTGNTTTINSRFLMMGLSEYSTANLTPTATQLIENACYYLMEMNIPNSIGDMEEDALIIKQEDGQISIEGVDVLSLTLFNIVGRQIADSNDAVLATAGISRGVYILTVRTTDGVMSRKIVL